MAFRGDPEERRERFQEIAEQRWNAYVRREEDRREHARDAARKEPAAEDTRNRPTSTNRDQRETRMPDTTDPEIPARLHEVVRLDKLRYQMCEEGRYGEAYDLGQRADQLLRPGDERALRAARQADSERRSNIDEV